MRTVTNEALGVGVRDGLRDRRLNAPDPFTREDGVESGGELAVAITDQKPERGACRLLGEVAGLLGNPAAGWALGDSGEVDASCVDLDEEQHVDAAQPDRVDAEEVAREDTRGLGVEELAPRWPLAARSRVEPGAEQDAADGARRDADAELCDLAGDSWVAPAGVLARESQDRLAGLRRNRRPAATAVGMMPALPSELAILEFPATVDT